MEPKILGRVFNSAMQRFATSLRDDLIGAAFLAVAVLRPFVMGKPNAGWEAFEDAVAVIVLMLLYVLVRAIVDVWDDIETGSKMVTAVPSLLHSPDGSHATIYTTTQQPPHFKLILIAIGVISGLVLLGAFIGVHQFVVVMTKTSIVPAPLAPTEVYWDCHQAPLPLHVPPHSTVHVKVFNKKQYINTKDSMYDVRNDGDKELLWPDNKLIHKVRFNPGHLGWQCELSNHAQSNLMDVAVKLNVTYDNDKPPLDYYIVASPLDAGSTFPLFMINECPATVAAVVQDQIGVEVVGENIRRRVPLHFPNRSVIQQIVVFFGSPVSWTGNQCN